MKVRNLQTGTKRKVTGTTYTEKWEKSKTDTKRTQAAKVVMKQNLGA